jgi:hypothetical protein
MGKKWDKNTELLDILENYDFVDIVAHKFDWVDSELPFFRIISDYKNIIFLEI